jgi:hypothetical protein
VGGGGDERGEVETALLVHAPRTELVRVRQGRLVGVQALGERLVRLHRQQQAQLQARAE